MAISTSLLFLCQMFIKHLCFLHICICIVQRNWTCLTWKSVIEIKSLLLSLCVHRCKEPDTDISKPEFVFCINESLKVPLRTQYNREPSLKNITKVHLIIFLSLNHTLMMRLTRIIKVSEQVTRPLNMLANTPKKCLPELCAGIPAHVRWSARCVY